MAIIKWREREWSPFRELIRLQDEMDRLFGETLTRESRWGEPGFAPPIDLYSENGCLRARVDLPGIKKEDITVTCTGTTLTIHGARKQDHEVKGEGGYEYSERSWGEFERIIELPLPVESGKVEATYSDGVLDISLPVREEVKPKQIEVKVH